MKFDEIKSIIILIINREIERRKIFRGDIGINEGLKHDRSIHCDELISLPKYILTDYVGKLPSEKLHLLERSLKITLQLNNE